MSDSRTVLRSVLAGAVALTMLLATLPCAWLCGCPAVAAARAPAESTSAHSHCGDEAAKDLGSTPSNAEECADCDRDRLTVLVEPLERVVKHLPVDTWTPAVIAYDRFPEVAWAPATKPHPTGSPGSWIRDVLAITTTLLI